jgi:hypothetical protein
MKTRFLLCFCAAIASLQAQNNLKTTTIDRYYNGVKQNIIDAANEMPADKYEFKLTDGQMTFGQWINHSTERNYLDCSTLRGEPNPMPKAQTDMIKGKANVIKNLKDSFDYCDATFEKLDDAKILSTPALTFSFLHTAVHNNEIYGNIVGYLRASGMVPLSTERMNTMMKGKKKQ